MNSYVEVFSCDYTKKQIEYMYGKLEGFHLPGVGEQVFINIPYKAGDIRGITSIVKSESKSTYGKTLYTLKIAVPK